MYYYYYYCYYYYYAVIVMDALNSVFLFEIWINFTQK